MLSYAKAGLIIKRGGTEATETQIRDLQRDLRALGYLRRGIDGKFGKATELAVRALQYDLLNNDGKSTLDDGEAPLSVKVFNRGSITEVNGIADKRLADCMLDILSEPLFTPLPKANDPRAENNRVLTLIKGLPSKKIPMPFLLAILKQESGLKHFSEPHGDDEDTYITAGLDFNSNVKYNITSRGYGAGQYTLFHHPPRKEEIEEFMLDVGMNIKKAENELREKFDYFVNGPSYQTRADDRIKEYGDGPLRVCKYVNHDLRYMNDCKRCMEDAGTFEVKEDVTPVLEGSSIVFRPTRYYRKASYGSVPIRKNVGCDWPYAVRRYNGSGINSYHYQVRVLKNVLSL